jgi:Protein of unknown function DUF86
VSRHDVDRLIDVIAAVEAVQQHLTRGDLSDGLVYDAVRARLIEIGEAVKGVSAELLATEPAVPWRAIARMRAPSCTSRRQRDRAASRNGPVARRTSGVGAGHPGARFDLSPG